MAKSKSRSRSISKGKSHKSKSPKSPKRTKASKRKSIKRSKKHTSGEVIAWCTGCEKHVKIMGATKHTAKNKRKYMKGECEHCSRKCCVFISNDSASKSKSKSK